MRGRVTEPLSDRSWPGVVAVLVAGVGFAAVDGLPGVTSAIGVGIVWLLLPAVYAVALGYGLLAALTISEGASIEALVAGLGLFVILLTPAPRLYRRQTLVSATLVTAGALLVVFGVTFATTGALWTAAVALAVAWTVAAYGVHRYELMILGLAEGSS